MVKLVVSDLDGTLIDSSEQLTDTAREMARWLKDRNVLFTFATGRVQGMTERYAQDMQVSIPYVATNGAALIAPDGVLFRRKVPLKPLETMLRKADSMGMSIIYSEDGYEKVCRETPYILRQRAAFGRYNDVAPLTQADYDGKQMEKICVMDSDKTGDKINYVEDFIRRLGDQYSYTWFEQAWIPAGAEHLDAAKQFVAYLYSDEACKLFAESGAIQPVLGIADDLDGDNKMFYSIYDNGAKAAMGNFAAFSAIPGVEVRTVFFDPVNSLVSGSMTEQQWIDGIKSASDQMRANIIE